ncbi:uncharacterized protein LOC114934696 [Nylanderia fulva]|uniref:uncharacterized protein LOC114934696 n=1 Tax=Nylanderia fulva TaxID=613905 RepID=UPI0010FAEAF4|nr:uncharacterized protein LOC114934696 [Nylanderia fulva]XP_029163238.1 uncharacterized protein LOC114934696 [Nylanderia fulva]
MPILWKEEMGIEFDDVNIKDLKEGKKCVEDLWLYVSRMSAMYHYCKEKEYITATDINQFLSLHKEKHPFNMFILLVELIGNIFQQDPRQSNLTEKYYSIQIFRCLSHDIFNLKWHKLLEKLPNQEQRLEDMFVIILRRYHPDKFITILHVDNVIDNIVQEVLKFLKDKYPQHPILSIQPEQFAIWRNNYIDKNYWDETHALSIKYALDNIIVSFDSYESWMEPNQISTERHYKPLTRKDILRYKHMLWLTIYICVANRLGLRVSTKSHDGTDCIRDTHLVHHFRNNTENLKCFTFGWAEDAKIFSIRECRRGWSIPLTNLHLRPSLSMQIYEFLTKCEDTFTDYNKYISPSITLYNETICSPDEMFRKTRSPNLKFAIGMIVTHKHDMEDNTQKDITGVIIGWHNECHIERFRYKNSYCIPNKIKKECIEKYNIKDWKSQPYYVMLVENKLCYVPQCAITSTCEEWINNSETGRFFCKFEGTHYVPNKMLEKYYPDDAAVVREILSSRKL